MLCNEGGTKGVTGTYVEVVTTTIEDRVVSDLVRGEGRANI